MALIPSNGKSPLAELMPGSREVLVGEQVLTLKAPVLHKLNQAWRVIDDEDFQEALSSLKGILLKPPPAKELAAAGEEPAAPVDLPTTMSAGIRFVEQNFDYMVTVLRKGLMPIVTQKLADVIAVALDTKANRSELEAAGVENTSVAFQDWVVEEITMPQAVYVLEALRDLSGWGDMGKRLWKLFAGSFQKAPAALTSSTTSASPS